MAAPEHEIPRYTRPSTRADGIPAGAKRRTGSPRQVIAACIAGASMLALLSPPDTAVWSERAADHPFAATAREIVDLWAEEAARFDLTLVHQALRRTVRRLIELQWR